MSVRYTTTLPGMDLGQDTSEITRHSIYEDQSLSTTHSLDDFQDIHNNYTRGLLKGRHPRSFPRQSELWHH
jgi:hypothetical protein